MADDANKTAAAILAAEASRQKRELNIAAIPKSAAAGYDIAGEMWTYFEHFLRLMEERDKQSRP